MKMEYNRRIKITALVKCARCGKTDVTNADFDEFGQERDFALKQIVRGLEDRGWLIDEFGNDLCSRHNPNNDFDDE